MTEDKRLEEIRALYKSEIDRLKETESELVTKMADEVYEITQLNINLQAENKELKEEKKESIFKLAEIKELERHVKQYAVDNVLTKNEIFEMKAKLKEAEEGLEKALEGVSHAHTRQIIYDLLKSIRGESK